MRVFLDLDLTLVNVFEVWEGWITQVAAQLKMEPAVVRQIGESIYEGGRTYSLEAHLRELIVDTQLPWTRELSSRFVARVQAGETNYEDTAAFLDALEAMDCERHVLSFGDPGYQSVKVEGLRRAHGYFAHLHFTSMPGQKADVLSRHTSPNDRVYFVDDNPKEHARVAQVAPHVRRIQIRRSDNIAIADSAHAVVSNLQGVLEVMRR